VELAPADGHPLRGARSNGFRTAPPNTPSANRPDGPSLLTLHSADPHDGPELNNKPVLAELDVRVANACRRLFKLSLDERFFDIASR
jgi:hypothetical protein